MATSERAVLDVVGSIGLPYEALPCDPDLADTAAFCDHYGYPPEQSANTIVVASKRPEGHNAACVVLSHMRLDVNHTVKRLLGVRKLSFAPEDLTAELTGMVMGGVTPFGLDLPVYVDQHVMDCDWVILGGGSRSMKIKISPDVFGEMAGVEIIQGLALA